MGPELRLVYRGRNQVAGARCAVESFSGESGYHLRVGRYRFDVSRSDGRVRAITRDQDPGAPADPAVGAPAAVLSLALGGRFCLHASAVETSRGVLAFVGRSGKGKSTLAAHLAAFHRQPWELVSDDVLPVDFFSNPPAARRSIIQGNFLAEGKSLPLGAIYVLRNSGRDEVTIADLSRSQAFVTLARHTVASRLFDASLKATHFDACVTGSCRIPVRDLCYPRRLSVLDEVRRKLEDDLGSLPLGV